jgi:adenylate cyclase
MSGVIFRCNGTLDKFIGDCIMALFGAPVASDRAAQDALDAALGMQQALKVLNQSRVERNLRPFQIGIGLHCGLAVVGNIGSADRVQYTAIGDTVNVAARLVNKAGAGQIIVSEAIRASIPEFAGFDALGEVDLKGRASKMNIYAVRD